MRSRLSSAVLAACISVGLIVQLTGCASPDDPARQPLLSLGEVQRFTWQPESMPELGTVKVGTSLISGRGTDEMVRVITLHRADGEEFPTKEEGDDERIVLPIVREIVDAHYCPDSGLGRVAAARYVKTYLDLNDILTAFFGPPLPGNGLAPEDNIVFLSSDRTYTRPQKLKVVYVTCQRGTAHELRKTVGDPPNMITVPQTGQGSYETVHKQAPLSGPLQTW
ncbi:hypothetical protein EOI86_18770 [Hwanghaeella grinnelliae]|uniref:Uncharacterized protein n=1 Tax=Hwanghaeella grinnelliae TaxID=2500179 RepID=A0A437QKD0_9PROT|nr:hypothetical protein [Hwanghaeella grinnelliae]RVU34882.1 hypothetical protein EOI86_18770 [Hwanghaeella grinnelliae]